MDNESYQRIRSQLSFQKIGFITAGVMLVDAGLLLFAIQLLRMENWLAFGLSQLLLVTVFLHAFGLFHEAVHGNVTGSRLFTTVLGNLWGVLCFLPFESWKTAHLQHHRWTGNVDKDPVMRLVKTFDPQNQWQMLFYNVAWRSWLPILAILQHIVFWSNTFIQLRDSALAPRLRLRILVSALIPPLTYTLCHLAWPGIFNLRNFMLPILVHLALTEIINFPHHLGRERLDSGHVPPKDQHRFTRSCHYPPWVAMGFLLNFNFHVEHHLFPTLPWHELAKARELVKAALGEAYTESQRSDWIKENRRKDMREVVLPPAKPMPANAPWRRAA